MQTLLRRSYARERFVSHTLNDAQQHAVDRRTNTVVSAGAGSGKTRVLADRFVALVQSGESTVDRILTLTFTRKAAAEMFDRIHETLRRVAERDGRVRRQLELIDQAQISTLDSFAASLLRDGAGLFGLRPDFSVDADQLRRETERSALAFVRDNAEQGVVANYLSQAGFKRTVESPFLDLALHHFSLARPVDFPALFAGQLQWLSSERNRKIDSMHSHVAALLSTPLETAGVVRIRDRLRGCAADEGETVAALRSFSANVGGSTSPEGAEFRGHLRTAKEAATTVGDIDEFLRRSDEVRQLGAVLEAYQEYVLHGRRESGVLGYGEVFDLALEALQRDGALRSYYKGRFDFIMIDEFQDNNASQRDLLFILAERLDVTGTGVPAVEDLQTDKLFFVGDQKQSIYRFRGADVSVFRQLARDFDRLSLTANYRSDPELISFFNRFFAHLFTGGTRAFDADFEPLEAGRSAPDGRFPAPVHIARVDNPKERREGFLYDQRAEAAWIADRIETIVSTGGEPATSYGDIAILLRVGSNQQRYEQALRKRGIPYRTNALRSLFLEAPASDIYNVLQLVFYPADRSAYAAVLRGPLVRVSDAALVELLVHHREALPFAPCDLLAEADRFRYERGGAMYRDIADSIDRVPLSWVLDRIRHAHGYRYSLLAESRFATFREHFVYLQQIAAAYRNRPAIEFVDYLRANLGAPTKLDDAEIAGGDAVSIMTIHRSKGLEFPVVFLADAAGKPRHGTKTVWRDRRLGVTVALPDRPDVEQKPSSTNLIARYAAEMEAEEEAAELKRLLYVAATRAERSLVITAAPSRGGGGMMELVEGVLGRDDFADLPIETIPAIAEGDWEALRHRGVSRSRAEIEEHLLGASVFALPPVTIDFAPSSLLDGSGAEPPDRDVTSEPEAASEPGATGGPEAAPDQDAARGPEAAADQDAARGPDPATESEPAREPDAAEVGTLIHRRIESTLDVHRGEPVEPWNLAGDSMAAGRAAEIADAFLSSPAWLSFLARLRGFDVAAEVPFLFYLPGSDDSAWEEAFFSGAVDAVFTSENRTVIVDFKSDSVMRPADHRVQLALYRRAFAEIHRRPVEAYIAYVRFQEILRVEDEIDDREIRRLVGQSRQV